VRLPDHDLDAPVLLAAGLPLDQPTVAIFLILTAGCQSHTPEGQSRETFIRMAFLLQRLFCQDTPAALGGQVAERRIG
jgi:hypothetical protein